MDKFMGFLETNLVPIASKISSNKYLKAISGAFIITMSATIVGSLFTLLANLPFKPYTNWLAETGFGAILSLPAQATVDLIALYASFFVAYSLAREFKVDGAGAGLASLVSFMLVTGRTDGAYATAFLGAKGLFTAMIVGLITARIYVFILQKGWVIKLPDSVPPNVANSFSALIPTAIVVTFFLVVAALFAKTPYGSVHNAIFTVLQQSLMNFMGNNIVAYVFSQFCINILWFFGLHGGNIVGSITNPIYTPLTLENFALYQAGKEPIHIISGSFAKCYQAGGVASMWSLAIIMAVFSKSEQFKTLGRISVPTTTFFINEPLIFGIPIVLNPLFFIPMMFITPIISVITYFMMSAGIIPIPIGASIPWTTPPIVYGLLQGSWKIAAWEVFANFLAGCMWFPFFKVADKRAYEEEQGIK